jgi:hypothetical protein
MKTILFNVSILLALFTTIGCSPVYYKPALMNSPNFREKGQVHLAANLADAGGDIEAAYAITQHFAIQGNFLGAKKQTETTSTVGTVTTKNTTTTNGSLGEIAAGYFSPLGKNGTFGLYGGYGLGKVKNDWNTEGVSSANFGKLFIQPTLGLRWNYVELIGSIKLANLNYTNLNQTFKKQAYIDQFNVLKNAIPIMETGLTLRVGAKRVKLQLQANSLKILRNSIPLFQYEESSFGAGICVQLNGNMPKT